MKYVLKITANVFEELNETALYYKNLQNDLGLKLADDWEDALSALTINPYGYEKRYKNFRCVSLTQFPYLIVFEVEENEIVVYRFIHAKRSLKKRHKRIKKS